MVVRYDKKNAEDIDKVLILGIDALEYNLVERWDLKHIKQEEHGKTILPIYEDYIYDEPSTTIMWPSFITGRKPAEHGITTVKVWDLRILTWITKKMYVRNKKRAKEGGKEEFRGYDEKGFRLHKITEKFGIRERYPEKKDLRCDTLFDGPFRSVVLHVPGYNPPEEAFPECKDRIMDALHKKGFFRIKWEMECRKSWKQREKELFIYLEKIDEWDIFMQYFFTLDAIQHAFPDKISVIKNWYIMLDEMVRKVRENIPENCLLLIVSDHGQERGIHTKHGFYSVNRKLGLKNPQLIDFRWIIEDILGNEKKTQTPK